MEYLLKTLREEVQACVDQLRIQVTHMNVNDLTRQDKIVELRRYERWAKVLSQVLDPKN